MDMEHRFRRRQHVRLGVKVYLGSLPMLSGLTRNVSGHGVNLAMTHPELGENRTVTITLAHVTDRDEWQTRARVVHASEKGGTGLALEEDLPEDMWRADPRHGRD